MKRSIRLDKAVEGELRELVARQNTTISAFVRAAIWEKLEREEGNSRAPQTRPGPAQR